MYFQTVVSGRREVLYFLAERLGQSEPMFVDLQQITSVI